MPTELQAAQATLEGCKPQAINSQVSKVSNSSQILNRVDLETPLAQPVVLSTTLTMEVLLLVWDQAILAEVDTQAEDLTRAT